MPRTRPPYPPEFRAEAVQLVLASRSRRRLKRVEQERDIVKRAAVLFATETETR